MILPGPNNPFARITRGLLYAWLFALVLSLYPYAEDPAGPVKLLASAGFALTMTIVWATGAALRRTPVRRLNPACVALLFFLGIQMLAALLSESPARSLVALQPWCLFALIGLVGYQVTTSMRHVRNLFRTIVLSVALSSLYGLLQYGGLDPFPWAVRDIEEYRGLPATYGNPNLAGHTLVIALVLGVALLVEAWLRRKRALEPVVWALVAMPVTAHLYLTGMRGGAAALLFTALFTAVYMFAAKGGRTPVRAGLVALAATIVTLTSAVLMVLPWAPSLALDSSLQLRLNGYAGAAALYLDHWLIGIGPGNYAANNITYWTDFESLWYALEGKRNFHVHNEWLEVAVASGMVGITAFSALFLFAIMGQLAAYGDFVRRPIAGKVLLLALPAVMVAIGVDALTSFNLHAPVSAALFFLLLVQRPSVRSALPLLAGHWRFVPLLLVGLAVVSAFVTARGFQGERLYQRARGAMAWEQAQRAAGDFDAAAHGQIVARASLNAAAAYLPWSHRVPMLAGDFELQHGKFDAAASHYAKALALMPDLPRLHAQLARAHVRRAHQHTGPVVVEALTQAHDHAETALEHCPGLAEAWAMLGWIAYIRAELQRDGELTVPWQQAVDAFERARTLGLAENSGLNFALAAAYGRLDDWRAAATLYERCALTEPDTAAHWERFDWAAVKAGGPWPARYRQSLLHVIARGVGGPALDDLAGRLARTTDSVASKQLVRAVLAGAVQAHPERLALWGAWLETVEPASRALELQAQASPIDPKRLPDALRAMLELAAHSNITSLDRAASALLQALATAPGGERTGSAATACQPLTGLLHQLGTSADLWESTHPVTRVQLGAALVEAGEPAKADALLRQAEQSLSAARRPQAWYYRSRALYVLGQWDAALALAQQAAKPEDAPLEHTWQMARCMAATGNRDAARFIYQSLTSRLPPDHPYRAIIAERLAALEQGKKDGTG